MTKKELIRENWIQIVGVNLYNRLKEWINEDGFGLYPNVQGHDVGYTKNLWENVDGLKIRPISLRGIENNNGWIKIESEADLPKDEPNSLYFMGTYSDSGFKIRGGTLSCNGVKAVWEYEKHTHYKPIEKPLSPLF